MPWSAFLSNVCPDAKTPTAAKTAREPSANGTWRFQCSTIVPAANGARPPPMNRTKPYDADAIGNGAEPSIVKKPQLWSSAATLMASSPR